MKQLLITAALMLSCAWASAQECVYFLPSTTITVNVDAEQETFFAGPYAAYAKKLLNLDVRKNNEITSRVTGASISTRTEADMNARFIMESNVQDLMALSAQGLVSFGQKADADNASWRFLPELSSDFSDKGITSDGKEVTRIVYKTVKTDSTFTRVPVEQSFTESKTIEDKAKEAADIILSVRKQRMDIASGDTDATFSGAALADALKELKEIEQEYLVLFRGYSVTRQISASFDVVPGAYTTSHKYLAFRTDPERGLVSNGRGTPYYIELEPEGFSWEEPQADVKKQKGPLITYRIPLVCRLTLTQDGLPLAQGRVAVYQMGKEATYPAKK